MGLSGQAKFGEVVRANRRRLGLTQEDLSASTGLNVRSIRKIEAGLIETPRPATVRLLADAFGLMGTDRERFCQAVASEPIGPSTRPNVPMQLPADVSAFTGRAEQLAALETALITAGDQSNTVIISVLSGTAGVGKTALAVHWAHRVRGRFPDGQLYVNLRGYDPDQPTEPGEVLAGLLSSLGVTGQDVPQKLDDRAARYRSELADRRMLIVLDNAGSVEQVRPLLPGSGSSTVVVTSRDRLAGLVAVHGARRLDIDALPPSEAVTLLRRLIGARVDADPGAAATLADHCARLPLALRIAAELAVSRPTNTLAELVAELDDQQRRLDLLDGGDPHATVRTVFSWSIQRLPPDAAGIFRLLGLHPGPDIDTYAAAALAGTNVDVAHHRLELLVRASLMHSTSPGRYGMHDLLRAYATELTNTHDNPQIRHAALARLLDHYRYAASVATDAAYAYERERRPQVPPAATATPELNSSAQAIGWLDSELPNLLAAARHAATAGWPEHTLDLSAILHQHLRTRGRYAELETLHRCGLAAARDTGNTTGELHALNGLGYVHWLQCRYDEALGHLQEALDIARVTESRDGESYASIGIGWICVRQGRYELAAYQFTEALRVAGETNSLEDALLAHIGHGYIRWLRGGYEQARHRFLLALEIAQDTHNLAGKMEAVLALGNAHRMLGRYDTALADFGQALAIAADMDNRYGRMHALLGLGNVHRMQARYEPALDAFEEALAIARATQQGDAEMDALNGLGHVQRQKGAYDVAAERYRQALDKARDVGARRWQFEAINGIGRLRSAIGHADQALRHHHEALVLATDLRHPTDQARAHDGLAYAHRALSQHEQARQQWRRALDLLASVDNDCTEDPEAKVSTIRARLSHLAR